MGARLQWAHSSRVELLEDLMALKRIRLELARAPEAPEGNPYCGYEFTAPLDKKGRLDPKQWAYDKDKCTVRRFWNSTTDEHGKLSHHRGSDSMGCPDRKSTRLNS